LIKRTRLIAQVVLAVLVLFSTNGSLFAAAAKPTVLSAIDYMPLKYVNDRGEYLQFRGYKQFNIDWILETDADDIAMNQAKTLIYLTENNSVAAYDLTGQEMWRCKLQDYGFNYYQLEIGVDGTVYAIKQPRSLLDVRSPAHVIAISEQGEIQWEYKHEFESDIFWVIYCGGPQETFVMVTEEEIIGVRNGEVVWTNHSILKPTNRVFDMFNIIDSNIYDLFADHMGNTYVVEKDKLYALDKTGVVKWSLNSTGDFNLVQNDEYLLDTTTAPWTLVDAKTGKILPNTLVKPEWLKNTAIPTDLQGGAYLSNWIRNDKNGLSKVDAKGNVIWSYKIRFSGYPDAYEFNSDAQGNIFFTDNGGTFYSLDRNGNERFMIVNRNKYGPDSTECVIDSYGNVYALFSSIVLFKIVSN
jgi:hypothetical protein